MVPLTTLWLHMTPKSVAMMSVNKKTCCTSFLSSWLRNAMVLLMTPTASHDINVAPHFGCLNLRSAVVPLMMLLASCDTDARANGTEWPKHHILPHFNCLDLSNAIFYAMGLVSLASHDQKSYVTSSFDHFYLGNGMVPLMKCCSIIWHWHQHQWHSMTMSYVAPHFNFLD